MCWNSSINNITHILAPSGCRSLLRSNHLLISTHSQWLIWTNYNFWCFCLLLLLLLLSQPTTNSQLSEIRYIYFYLIFVIEFKWSCLPHFGKIVMLVSFKFRLISLSHTCHFSSICLRKWMLKGTVFELDHTSIWWMLKFDPIADW